MCITRTSVPEGSTKEKAFHNLTIRCKKMVMDHLMNKYKEHLQ